MNPFIIFPLLIVALGVAYYINNLSLKADLMEIDRDYWKAIAKIEQDYGKKVEESRDICMAGWTRTLDSYNTFRTRVFHSQFTSQN